MRRRIANGVDKSFDGPIDWIHLDFLRLRNVRIRKVKKSGINFGICDSAN